MAGGDKSVVYNPRPSPFIPRNLTLKDKKWKCLYAKCGKDFYSWFGEWCPHCENFQFREETA